MYKDWNPQSPPPGRLISRPKGGHCGKLPKWFVPAYCGLVVGVFFLIALGGSVRIMKAGLACPDWPLCFGDVIPDYHPQVYFEFIHRVVAGTVAFVTFGLQIVLFRSAAPRLWKILAGVSLALLAGQIVFGGLTVLLLLKSGVVLTHLILGTSFFAILLWIYLSLRSPAPEPNIGPGWMYWQCAFVLGTIAGQIMLGGEVASNFASLVCAGWPKCNGEWFPTFSGIIGMHLIHRLGAYFVFAVVVANAWLMEKHARSPRLVRLSRILFVCVCGQIGLGIANVLLYTPPLIAVMHLALGVGMLSIAIRQMHAVRGLRASEWVKGSARPGLREFKINTTDVQFWDSSER